VRAVEDAERATADGTGMLLRLAVDYSSRGLLLEAVRAAATASDLERQDIAALLGRAMHGGGPAPDVDLLIRTGGERRLSDFLLWECAYAELLFTPVMWPDYGAEHLEEAIRDFQVRDRRFGRVAAAS
jgi:undecaprenyl diphosphate synthase